MGTARDLSERAWKAFESQDFAAFPQLFAADAEFVYPGGVVLHGPAELEPFIRGYWEAAPDLHVEELGYIESGEDVAVELRIRGTHTGTLHTPGGDVPATGAALFIESVDFIRTRDGKIQSWHVYYDSVPMLQSLGLMPAG